MYMDKTLGFRFETFYSRSDYELKKIVKFASTSKLNVIKFSSCDDLKYEIFKSEWDIYVMWVDPIKVKPSDIQSIKRKFSRVIPLYAVFGENYVLITKIISKQIFQTANKCTSLEIMDLFLFEMGAVLCEKNLRPLKQFKGSDNFKMNVIWSVPPLKELIHIEPRMHGWFSKNTELSILYVLKNYKYKTIIELGSWLGKSSSCIVKNMKNYSTLYCFDKFQNITKTPYHFTKKDKLDLFYLRTPRFETFCRNVSPFITENKTVYTIKYDVNRAFEKIIKPLSIHFDIVFIDAIKNKSLLIIFIEKCLFYNPKVVIVGDDYVFNSVKEAISLIQKKYSDINLFITEDSYILTYLELNKLNIQRFIKKNYFPPKSDPFHYYDIVIYFLEKQKYNEIIDILKKNDTIDINKKIPNFNDNTLYNLFVFHENNNKTKMKELMHFLRKNYKPRKIENVLGLDYSYYVKNNNTSSFI